MESYYNADAAGYTAAGTATVNLISQLAANKAQQTAASGGCKKPSIFGGGNAWRDYNECKGRVAAAAEAANRPAPSAPAYVPPPPAAPAGMSTGMKVGIGVGVALLLTVITVLVVRRKSA
jgi:hypothetical protein